MGKEKITGDCAKLCKQQLNDLVPLTKCYWGDQFKASGMGRACGTYGAEEKCIHVLVVKHEGKKTTCKTQA